MTPLDPREQPPLFRRWRTWYGLVIGFLVLLIGLFYALTRHFQN